MRKGIVLLIVCSALLSFAAVSCAQKEGVGIGDEAPNFTLEDLQGNSVSLKDAVPSSKAVLLSFFTTWCPSCVKEVPELNRADRMFSKDGLKILAVNLGESKTKVASFASKKGAGYTILLDESNVAGSIFGIRGIPHNILLDKNGIIKYRGTALPSDDIMLSE